MKKYILVIDDEPSLAFFLAESLTELGPDYEIRSCNFGVQAIRLTKDIPFDVVITDLVMRDVNGLELVRRLQQEHPNIEFILMTAYGNETTIQRAQELGIASYITKPFRMEDMLKAVQKAVSNPSLSHEGASL